MLKSIQGFARTAGQLVHNSAPRFQLSHIRPIQSEVFSQLNGKDFSLERPRYNYSSLVRSHLTPVIQKSYSSEKQRYSPIILTHTTKIKNSALWVDCQEIKARLLADKSYIPTYKELESATNMAAYCAPHEPWLRMGEAESWRKTMEDLRKLRNEPQEKVQSWLESNGRTRLEECLALIPESAGEEVITHTFPRKNMAENTLPVPYDANTHAVSPQAMKNGEPYGFRDGEILDTELIANLLLDIYNTSPEQFSQRFPGVYSALTDTLACMDPDQTIRDMSANLTHDSKNLKLAFKDEKLVGVSNLIECKKNAIKEIHDMFGAHVQEGQACEISLIIGKNHQRKGIGQKLLADNLEFAQKAGYKYIIGTVQNDNDPMLVLAKKMAQNNQIKVAKHVNRNTGLTTFLIKVPPLKTQ